MLEGLPIKGLVWEEELPRWVRRTWSLLFLFFALVWFASEALHSVRDHFQPHVVTDHLRGRMGG